MYLNNYIVTTGDNMTFGDFLNFGQIAEKLLKRSAGLRIYAYIGNNMKPQSSRLNGAVRA